MDFYSDNAVWLRRIDQYYKCTGDSSGKECLPMQVDIRSMSGFDPWVRKSPWRSKQQPTPGILAWRIPWTEKPGWLPSMGSQRIRHNWVTKHSTAYNLQSIKTSFQWSIFNMVQFSSVQFSHSVVSDSLWPHELQHARPPCPSPTPRVHSDSCPSSQWCHPTISSSVIPFSSCPQSFPASGSFQMSQLFTSGGQSTGVSALASFLPKKSQGWCPSEWTGWISLQSKGLSRVLSNTTVQKHQFFGTQLSS